MVDLNRVIGAPGDLMALLEGLPDPRKRRGIRHRQGSVLAVAICACLTGARSFVALGEWAAALPQEALQRLGCRWHPTRCCYLPPSEPTVRRTLQAVDCELIDRELGAWMGRRAPGSAVGVDGKALRGAVDKDGNRVHLLSALVHKEGVVIGQRSVESKHNEITEFRPLLEPLDLAGKVVTADAIHTQKEHARFLVEEKRADYLFTVKENQPTLLDDLKALDQGSFPPPVAVTGKGHGRIERRSTQTSTALNGYINFPYVAQVFRIERTVTHFKSGEMCQDTVYGITSLTPEQADARKIGELLRGHWEIENRLHWVRDVTFDEDRSQVRTGSGPRALASLRNFAISSLRLAGCKNIAQGLRHLARDWRFPLTLLAV